MAEPLPPLQTSSRCPVSLSGLLGITSSARGRSRGHNGSPVVFRHFSCIMVSTTELPS